MTSLTTNTAPRAHTSGALPIEMRIMLVVVVLVALWVAAIVTWGYPALIVPALALVPTMFVVLMLITVGK